MSPIVSRSMALGLAPSQNVDLNLVYGYVSLEQPPPTHFDDLAYVVVPSHSSEHSIPMAFPAIHGSTLPVAGTSCLVAYDERNVPWVVSWTGSYGD
jgi:hypothetical protein